MNITYKQTDGTLVYDVNEAVMNLIIGFSPDGQLTLAQVVRRRYLSINGTPVKEDSQPAQTENLSTLQDEVLAPTALSIKQITTALLLRLLQNAPVITGMQDVQLPALPDDIGTQIAQARQELADHSTKVAEVNAQLAPANEELALLMSKITSAQSNLSYLENGLKSMAAAGDSAKLALDAEIQELEAKKNSYTETLATLEEAIKNLSDESTTLQLQVAQLKATTPTTEN